MSFPEGSAALRAASLLDRQPFRPRRSPSRTTAVIEHFRQLQTNAGVGDDSALLTCA
jgi:hypothetical protein